MVGTSYLPHGVCLSDFAGHAAPSKPQAHRFVLYLRVDLCAVDHITTQNSKLRCLNHTHVARVGDIGCELLKARQA